MTGASGYIGGVVAERLREAGHNVIGLARSAESEATLRQRGISVIRGSITDVGTLTHCARTTDAVVYAAVEFSPVGFQEEGRAVAGMLQRLARTGKPFLFTSGPGVLGNSADRVLDEDSPYNPWPLMQARVDTEQAVLSAGNDGVRAIVIRPGMVYGRRGGNGAALYVETAARLGAAPYVRGTDAHWLGLVRRRRRVGSGTY